MVVQDCRLANYLSNAPNLSSICRVTAFWRRCFYEVKDRACPVIFSTRIFQIRPLRFLLTAFFQDFLNNINPQKMSSYLHILSSFSCAHCQESQGDLWKYFLCCDYDLNHVVTLPWCIVCAAVHWKCLHGPEIVEG